MHPFALVFLIICIRDLLQVKVKVEFMTWATLTQFRLHSLYKVNIGIKHGFSYINIRQVPWEVLKTEAEGRGFQHLPRDLANVNALKNHFRSLLLHKNWKHLLHFALFLALFCFVFSPRCRANAICTDYARSRAGQYTSCDGSNSVDPVQAYWKLRSRALLIHGFSPVNAWLLITCDTVFYAIIWCWADNLCAFYFVDPMMN